MYSCSFMPRKLAFWYRNFRPIFNVLTFDIPMTFVAGYIMLELPWPIHGSLLILLHLTFIFYTLFNSFFYPNRMLSAFSKVESIFIFNHCLTDSSSWLSLSSISITSLPLTRKLDASPYSNKSRVVELTMSCTWNVYNKVPRIDPWGTPWWKWIMRWSLHNIIFNMRL